MSTETGASSKGGWLLAAALAAGVLAALTAVLALAAPQRSFLHMATNLSDAPSRWSSFADIGVSLDGDRVVVVWPEAYEGGGGCGRIWLRWASESEGSGWSSPVVVFEDYSGWCASRAAVAVTGTTAHVAYIASMAGGTPYDQIVYYRACTLGGTCGRATVITQTQRVGSDTGFGDVDIALDAQGNPHFVYSYFRFEGGDVGTVYYSWLSGGSVHPQEQVSGAGQNAGSPAIAWSNGYVHVVWAEKPYGTSTIYAVRYLRRRSGGGGSWGQDETLAWSGAAYPPRNPSIAAYSGTVFAVWDVGYFCQEPPGGCDEFSLAYDHSLNDGVQWLSEWREVGTNGKMTQDMRYYSTDSQDMWEYTRCLRPTVALDGEGRPTVVWHVNLGSQDWPDYDIKYNEGLTVTQFGVGWSSTDGEFLRQRAGSQSGNPVIALAPVISPHLHVAYLWSGMGYVGQPSGDWETYYDSNEYDTYSHIFLPIILRNFYGGGET